MDKLTEWLNSWNPIITILTTVLTVLSFILAFYFYHKSIRRTALSYSINYFHLFHSPIQHYKKLEFFYDGKKVKTLNALKYVFWNTGHNTINKGELVALKPLMLFLDNEDEIYDIEILHSNNEASNAVITVIEEGKKYKIEFDYLDRDDGFIVKVLASTYKLRFSGKIKGIKTINYVKSPRGKLSRSEYYNRLSVFIGATLAIVGLATINIILSISLLSLFVLGLLNDFGNQKLPDSLSEIFDNKNG